MASRYIFKVCLLFTLAVLTACSGSGSGTTGSSRVTVSFGQATKAGKTVFAGATTATTSGSGLPSIVKVVTITVTAPGITTITRTINIAPGQTTVADSFTVPNGTGRVFTVIAQDNYGNTPYKGTATTDLSGTDVSLPIAMTEDATAAITAKLYLYFKDTIAAKGTALTTADLDPFYATTNFGLQNGLDRVSTVSFDVNDYKKGFLTKGMSSLTISAKPIGTTGQYAVMGKGTFADGSYGFPDDGFVMVKENGEWKITGNNFRSKMEFRGIAAQWLGGSVPRIESGLLVRVEDPGGLGLVSAVVQGPGLPAGGIVLAADPKTPKFLHLGNAYFATPQLPTMQMEMYVIDDATLSTIPLNASYTVSIYDTNNVVVETRNFVLPQRPWTRAELTTAHFPAFSGTPPITPISAATNGHFLADARIGSSLAYQVATPTAFAASWFDTSLDYFGWDTLGQTGYFFNRDLLLTDTSGSLSSVLPLITLGGSVSLTAEDFNNRRETMTVWLFNGPVATVQLSPTISFMTTTFPIAGGITSPATASVWRYGAAAPTVTWGSSLLTAPAVEVFLLADDPQKVATSTSSGNPFPGSLWIRLTDTGPVTPGSAGSFTLPTAVERLGIAGNGCRVLVVSTQGDLWALSQPFIISP